MDMIRVASYLNMKRKGIRFLFLWTILLLVLMSCKPEEHGLHQFNENILTIGEFLKRNRDEYSKFSRLLNEGDLLISLGAYNPYGDGYTLFLPTDEAVDQFIQQSGIYENFEEMLQDTSFTYNLVRYHTVNSSVRTHDFPQGALIEKTLTGDRLTIGIYTDGDNPLYKVNNRSSILRTNLEMTNGFVHVISEVLQKEEKTGYDWLQQQGEYSILARAMELTGVNKSLWVSKYTILAEHDSVYHRYGIMSVEDLIKRVATPGLSYSNKANSFYKFTGFHILGGEYYLNDFYFGMNKYGTLGSTQLSIHVGLEIRINPGVDTYGISISELGDTTVIDYIRPIWESSNIITFTGPVHSLSDILFFEPLN